MIKEPWFWRDRSLAGRAVALSLTPGAVVYDAARRLRAAHTRPASAPAPLFCVGNATLGGVGKTPFALMLQRILAARGIEAHFLTRGYGGALKGPARVDPGAHDAGAVGDEALLLAGAAPTWVSKDRPAGAVAAAKAGAQAIIMDDGFQNPTIEKTLSILLIDAADPYGNGRVFPAGPLREPAAAARARADLCAAVVGSADAPAVEGADFRVWLEPERQVAGERIFAFCGIGAPERFFAMLKREGAELAGAAAFPDHHRFAETEIGRLKAIAAGKNARLFTTTKDFARMTEDMRRGVETFPIRMVADDETRLALIAERVVAQFHEEGPSRG
ncbi:MAG: tetraacyldisaccharide 4'-kinase [Alphaproteobacteria bacterium]|nr:tetraacyldisaccharide 4'-kinase [Alphaproteobacteria bacterium]